MCVSHSNGIIVFQSGGGTSGSAEAVKEEKEMLACGPKAHGAGEVVLVSKTYIFSLNLLPLSGTVCCMGKIIASVPCLVVTMTRSTTSGACMCQQIVAQTQKNTPMGPKTTGLCYHEVSHGVITDC